MFEKRDDPRSEGRVARRSLSGEILVKEWDVYGEALESSDETVVANCVPA